MILLIHPTANVQSKKIGDKTQVWQNSVILPGATIGKNCNINCHCFIENNVVLGNNVTLKSGVYLWDGISIENDVFIGPNVTFTNDIRPRSKIKPKEFQKTVIMKGASIGGAAVIIGGITIGEYALIGAGAVVTKDVPGHTLWYGNPARFHAYVCTCGETINKRFKCRICMKLYKMINKKLVMIQ